MANTRSIIDEDIHPESEFENQYSEVEVTAEEFPALKASLYTHSGDADISNAQNEIVYKLYNDNGETIQVENVPVVKDGTSVDTVVEYYKRTDTATKPAKTDSGWYENYIPVFTGSNKYLWNYEKITDTRGNELTTTEPVLLDHSGKQIEYITEQYAVTTTTGTPSESDWGTTVPTLSATNKYLWNREKIKYINITEEETTLLAIIGVYGDKGDPGNNGADGEQGGGYLGPKAVEPATANTNDFYLDTSNQTIKYYNGSNWVADNLPSDPNAMSWRWRYCIDDCIALAGSSGNLLTAANAWVEKLVVGTVLADKIKANFIETDFLNAENIDADNLEADNCKFTDVTIDGSMSAKAVLINDNYNQGNIGGTTLIDLCNRLSVIFNKYKSMYVSDYIIHEYVNILCSGGIYFYVDGKKFVMNITSFKVNEASGRDFNYKRYSFIGTMSINETVKCVELSLFKDSYGVENENISVIELITETNIYNKNMLFSSDEHFSTIPCKYNFYM